MLASDALRIDFDMAAHWRRMRTLMRRHERMDLADACMVVMSEMHDETQVLTIDVKDFKTYRRNDRQVIPFVAPRQTN
jgi:predicted nucleic acid-binding protein